MSASEKLKALDGTMDGDWKRISPGAPLIEGPFADVQALCDLRNALPQIVAVVEAAEEVAERVPTIARPIPAALAALEEALS